MQLAKPVSHSIPHETPLHVAMAFAPVAQGAQLAPQVEGLSSVAHELPQGWKSAWHVKPQWPAAQVAWPLTAAGQAFPHAPQSSSEVSRLTHCSPQSVGAPAEQPVVHANPLVVGAQSGAAREHFALQVPQWAGCERSVSHPSAAL